MKDKKFPETIKEKGVSAIIRKADKLKAGKKRSYFIVEYILTGKRKQVWRSELDEARIVARDACIKIANGDQSSLELKDTDRLAYIRATETLSPLRIMLDVAARDYVSAVENLPAGTTLKEAVEFFRRRNPASFEKRTVREVVNDMLMVKRAAKLAVCVPINRPLM
jgi:hypothetical protein